MKLGANPDVALTEVLSKVQQVRGQLPAEAEDPIIVKGTGQTVRDDVSGDAEPEHDVGTAHRIYRARDPAAHVDHRRRRRSADARRGQTMSMRVWIDPIRLAARGLTAAEVLAAINNVELPVGARARPRTNSPPIRSPWKSTLQTPEAFARPAAAVDGGNVVRLRDVARVELAAESTDTIVNFNGKPGTFIGIFPTPGRQSAGHGRRRAVTNCR